MENIWKIGIDWTKSLLIKKSYVHPFVVVLQLAYLAYFGPIKSSLTIELCALTFLLI